MPARILVVDDDRVTSSLLEKLLQKQGFTVFTAADGQSGYELTKEHKPALVICDMFLPKVHGIDLCKKIKENENLKKTKVVLITAVYKGTAIEQDIKSWGADGYFEKPINTKRLLSWIEENVPKEILESNSDKNEIKVNVESMNIDEIMKKLESMVAKK
ncbi:MAG: response regulator [Candidatus Saccharicenans sp.]|nr:MAG: response regulator [Candidatus Aminicenantes bacterium]HEK85303.1 response regulator [Candidatus Aminicenantes bacterium]